MHIEAPTLLLNETIARRNIEDMAQKARQNNVRFRPHFKTHQSAAVGAWFRDYGVTAITCSSINMARYFADNGWEDITIAFPVNWRQIAVINDLAARINLNLLVESVETVNFLRDNLTASANLWLKIDVGLHRTGIAWDDVPHLRQVAQTILADDLSLRGLLTHSGHSYKAPDVQAVFDETLVRLQSARESLRDLFPNLELSLGDTPSCSMVDDFSAVDEIRPGNFALYDMMQVNIGSCSTADIAVGVACPVVAKHPERGTVIVHGGAVQLASDFIEVDGARYYGAVAFLTNEGWSEPLPGCFVQSISQEHGVIKVTDAVMNQIQVGGVLVVLPVHSCHTVAANAAYHMVSGETLAIARF
jgi:D-serine deaminase-like pyridoxal phosphate-dependent protein